MYEKEGKMKIIFGDDIGKIISNKPYLGRRLMLDSVD